MLLFIDPIVYIVHAYDVRHSALRERSVHVKQELCRDGEWVCAAELSPPHCHNTVTRSDGSLLIPASLF